MRQSKFSVKQQEMQEAQFDSTGSGAWRTFHEAVISSWLILMSLILHFDKWNPSLAATLPFTHTYVEVAEQDESFLLFISAQIPLTETVLVLGLWSWHLYGETLEQFNPHSLWLYHTVHSMSWYSFSAQVPSPQTLAIHTRRRSRRVLLWFQHKDVGQFGNCVHDDRR